MTSLMDESLASRSEENDDEEMEEFDEEALLDSEEMGDSPGLSSAGTATSASSLTRGAAATGEDIKCSACDFTSRSRVAVQRHERLTHLKKKFFRCVKCNYVTHVKARYTKHVKYHSMPMIKCDLCEFRTPYKWNLDRHLKNHMGGGMYKCSLCNFTAHIKQSLTVHIQNHHLSPDKAKSLRRRNKVGASDELTEATSTVDPDEMELLRLEREADREDFADLAEARTANEMTMQFETMNEEDVASKAAGLKITLRKIKSPSKNNSDALNSHQDEKDNSRAAQVKTLKCHLCSFQTVWEDELSLHEAKVHAAADQSASNCGLSESAHPVHPAPGPVLATETGSPAVKKARPIPNLIPITTLNADKVTPPPTILKIPQIHKRPVNDSATMTTSSSSPILEAVGLLAKGSGNDGSPSRLDAASPAESSAKGTTVNLAKKKTSFFDQLAEKLSASNMEHETKVQQQQQQTTMTTTTSPVPVVSRPLPAPNNGSLSSRCQHCRQRCKTRADLLSHLKQCPQALAASALAEKRPTEAHPMENKVFVWNRTEEPELEATEMELEEKRPSSVAGSDASEASLVGVETAPGIGAVTGGAGSSGFVTDGGRASVRRVYRCPQCSFWATTASRFHVHMVGHTNTKPFECSHCAYRSNWRWDITKHIKLKSARDPGHGQAKVVLLDASGERHYDQYDRYLVMMRVTEASGSTHGRLNEAAVAAGAGPSSKRPRKAGSLSPSPSASPSPAASPAPHQPPTAASESLASSFNIPGLSPAAVASLASSLASYAALHGSDVLQSIGKLSRAPLATDFPETSRQSTGLLCSEAGVTDNGITAAENRAVVEDEDDTMKKTGSNHVPAHTNEARRTVWKCKRCPFKDANRDAVLQHIRQLHYQGVGSDSNTALTHASSLLAGRDEAAAALLPPPPPGAAPIPAFRCGVCNQASNWKHVIQRHCRLKHNGNIQVIENKANEEDGPELAREVESPQRSGRGQFGAPPPSKKSRTLAPLSSYVDEDSMGYIMHPDRQQYICSSCPFVCKSLTDIESHRQQHKPAGNRSLKCTLCPFYVSEKNELAQHLLLHGLRDMTVDSLESSAASADQLEGVCDLKSSDEAGPSQEEDARRHRCTSCPYISDSKSQFIYHKQFHRPRGAPYKCPRCSYNVSRKHLLNQHLKVHGLPPLDGDSAFGDSEQYGSDSDGDLGSEAEVEAEALEAMEEFESAAASPSAASTSEPNGSSSNSTDGFLHLGIDPATLPRLPEDATLDLADVPLTWVSRGNKFFKMFKCRFCPHVNVRKANIQEHEKRHRTESSGKSGSSENLHACAQCNYRCNNAGVLSAHVKVHQNILGLVHAFVHPHQSDEDQLRELSSKAEPVNHETAPQPKLNLLLGKSASSPESSTNPDKVLHFCPHCPARFLVEAELVIHQRFHGLKLAYGCDFCSYTARQEHHLLAHWKVHNKEYQERTNGLMKIYKMSDKYPQPTVLAVQTNTGVVQDEEEAIDLSNHRSSGPSAPESTTTTAPTETPAPPKLSACPSCPAKFGKDVALQYHISLHGSNGPFKCRYCDYAVKAHDNLLKHEKLHCGVALPSPPRVRRNTEVPLSGLDLVLRREEHIDDPPVVEDTELPSSPKNGKSRGKRFKCPKCPSAFEKKEQFRIHSSLHGSKQRYRCQKCDYAVKYYTNFLQHVRKHKEDEEVNQNGRLDESDVDVNESSPGESSSAVDLSCPEDHQTTSERQQVWLHTKLSPPVLQDDQYAFQCQYCPYACATRDLLEQHVANHSINGAVGSYRCNFCDFTAAEQSGLPGHIKLHFLPKRGLKLDSYWKCANLEIWSEAVGGANRSPPESQAVYDENTKDGDGDESDEPDEDALFIDLSSGRPMKEDQQAADS